MEGYDHILERDDVAELNFVPNTIEDFHDTKKVRTNNFLFRFDILNSD